MMTGGRAMSATLFNLLFAWKCSSTHHKLAMDALRLVQGDAAVAWRNLCLAEIDAYLEGSKAPDNKFKDFRNHVLHVGENYWGGAVVATRLWYGKTVEAMRAGQWREAVYNAGVLSHYYTDPIQPLHTGQSEAEGIIHRASEWSIACAYRELTDLLETQEGWPAVVVPTGDDWLEQMVRGGAALAHPHYQACIDHYDLKRGVKHPPAGLDQELRQRLSGLIGHAVAGFARITEQALAEADVVPPARGLTLATWITQIKIPLLWVTQKMTNSRERAVVETLHKEFLATGKVLQTLPEDEATVRRAHADEVLVRPLADLDREAPGPVGAAYGTLSPPVESAPLVGDKVPYSPPSPIKPTRPQPPEAAADPRSDKFYLTVNMPVEKAPSIGPKTAQLLEQHGVKTVADLLCAAPQTLSSQMGIRYADPLTIEGWQIQAKLCCEVPRLRGNDAQIMLACGIYSREELATTNASELLKLVDQFVSTPAGERILRGSPRPDAAEVAQWVASAQRTRASRAA